MNGNHRNYQKVGIILHACVCSLQGSSFVHRSHKEPGDEASYPHAHFITTVVLPNIYNVYINYLLDCY